MSVNIRISELILNEDCNQFLINLLVLIGEKLLNGNFILPKLYAGAPIRPACPALAGMKAGQLYILIRQAS